MFPEIKAGASVRVSWLADFERGTPGKKLVSIIAQAQGMSLVRALKNIFVSQTTRDPVTGVFTCVVPEGTVKVSQLEGLPEFTVAGVASAIATGAAIVGMTDDKDCFRRGQEATPPGAGELTVAEKVEATFTYPGGAPNAGVAYPVHIVWKFSCRRD